ncbi:fibronectin type III domain-containing protein [Desulforegula conservatrix]|uniref:fibronectin type III domain-containing protein n=1 Tax=Desulforegula conservatrix TaxID=153026 RepID=UPI0018DD2FB0|nr:PQQ-binding-like beta-propeller repeat protein [Desulforegula conservatrix]
MKHSHLMKFIFLLFMLITVFACNGSGGGGDKPDERDTQSPSKPENVSAPEVSPGRVALSWPAASDNTGVARYRIYRNGSMMAESGGTSYIDTAIPDPGNYCYAVSAIDEAGNESEQSRSTCVDVPPQPDTEPPSVPSGVSASVTDSGVKITWAASIDNKTVAGYRVFRNGVKISEATDTSLSDSSVLPETRYCYTVSSFDASGNESAKSVESCVDSPAARDVQPPSVPANLRLVSSASSHDLSWSASSDNVAVAGYKIYKNGAHHATVTSTSFSDTGVSGEGQVCYAIMAFDSAGNESQMSDQACAASVSGKTKWKVEIDDQINTSMALSNDGTLYLITSKGTLYAIASDGTIKWKYFKEDEQDPFSKYAPVVSNGGTVYWGANQYLYANNADGTLKWKKIINSSNGIYDTTPVINDSYKSPLTTIRIPA